MMVSQQSAGTGAHRLAYSDDLGDEWSYTSWDWDGEDWSPATFLNFGKDYAGAVDDNVYLYDYPSSPGVYPNSTNIRLMRVDKDDLLTRASYRFFSGFDVNGDPIWSATIGDSVTMFYDPDGVAGNTTVVYNSYLQRFILTTSHGAVGELGIFESMNPWGPWMKSAYYSSWGGYTDPCEVNWYCLADDDPWLCCDGEKSGDCDSNDSECPLTYELPSKWHSAGAMWIVFSGYSPPAKVLDSYNLMEATLTLNSSPANVCIDGGVDLENYRSAISPEGTTWSPISVQKVSQTDYGNSTEIGAYVYGDEVPPIGDITGHTGVLGGGSVTLGGAQGTRLTLSGESSSAP
ncbi:unnamed protein product [marine sediment metagenome]|uniref:DUF4185 domain-containing protein n=1 Tax=marine sediment metagenome TaxID=412755 RepID=X0ZEF2_9ZZZZ